MAYGVRYFFSYDQERTGTVCKVEILQKDFTGTATELLKFGANPFTFSYPTDDDDFKPIKGSQATVTLMATSEGQFDDLFTSDDKFIQVKYYEGTTLKHISYATPDSGYEEPYIGGNYEVSFNTTDYLAQLKNIPYDNAGTPYTGRDTLLNIIVKCLNKIGFGLGIVSGVNVYEDSMDSTASGDPLAQTSVNQDVFLDKKNNPLDCYKVLDRILTSFNARIKQTNRGSTSRWWITKLRDNDGTLPFRVYDSTGTLVSSSTGGNTLKTTTANDAASVIRITEATRRREKAYKEFTNILHFGAIGEIIPDGGFEPNAWSSSTSLKNWDTSLGSVTREYRGTEDSYYSCILNSGNIKSSPTQLAGGTGNFVGLLLQIYFGGSNSSGTVGEGPTSRFELKITGSSSTYWWDNFNQVWTTTQTEINQPLKTDAWTDFNIKTKDLPIDGDLSMVLYVSDPGANDTNLVTKYDNIKGSYVQSNQAQLETREQKAELSNNIIKPDPVETYIGDAPSSVYPASLTVAGALTSLWARRGVTESRPLMQILVLERVSLSQRVRFLLSGNIITDGTVSFLNVITDYSDADARKFFFRGGTYNTKTAIWEGAELAELITTDASITFTTTDTYVE